MLALLLATCLPFAPQEPTTAVVADAVAVRGEAELTPAAAHASACRKAEDHVRGVWEQRATQALDRQRPFWVPEVVAKEELRRWLAELPVGKLARVVDREDRERQHEFGSSFQTTLWITEEPRTSAQSEQLLRRELRRLERTTAVKYGGVVAGWTLVALLVGWLDRLSRGYMTGRLRLVGLVLAAAFPALAYLL